MEHRVKDGPPVGDAADEAGRPTAPRRRHYDAVCPDDAVCPGSAEDAGITDLVLSLLERELADLAVLIEDKGSTLSARMELLVTLSAAGERQRSGAVVTADGGEAGYAPDAGGAGRLVEDMQYHDEACQRLACLQSLVSGLRERMPSGTRPVERHADAVLAMLDHCHLGSMRDRMKASLVRCTGDGPAQVQEHAEDETIDEEEDRITLF